MCARRGAVLRVAAVVAAVYAGWIVGYLAAGHEPRDFIKIGTSYLAQSDASSVIRFDPAYDYPPNRDPDFAGHGYDGQFSYFMALDPRHAHEYTDVPSYRYGRVLYPLLARGLALGHAGAIPWTLIVVNWLAVVAGTLLLADWLCRRGCPPWYAALFGLFPGMLLAVQRDLTEPLAYALVMAGVWALDLPGRRRIVLAVVAFGLAGLARQTTVVFPLCWALAAFARGRRREAVLLAAGGVAPMAIYNAAVLAWLGPDSATPWPQPVPFRGLFEEGWTWGSKPVQILTVVLPAVLFAAAVVAVARRRGWRVEQACYLANAALCVAIVRPDLYLAWTALGRQSTPVVLAAALCLPGLRDAAPRWRTAAAVAAACWLLLLPVVAVYGFLQVRVDANPATRPVGSLRARARPLPQPHGSGQRRGAGAAGAPARASAGGAADGAVPAGRALA